MMRIILALQFAVLLVLLVFFFGGPSPLSAQELTPPPSSTGSAAPSIAVDSSTNTVSAQAPLSITEMVVTASRLDVPASQVTSSLSVITAKDLEQKQAGSMLDALQQVPGLNVLQTGAPGEISTMYLRGSSDEHTLVMIDGIPLNDPLSASRSYDYLDQLSLDGVNRIEVVRGPQSTLYGSNAMAGVINILTPQGQGPTRGTVSLQGGSYGTFQESAEVNGGDTKGNFYLAGSHYDTAGFPSADKSFGNILNNPDNNTSTLLKLGAQADPNLGENLLLRYNQSRTNIDDGAGAGMDDPNSWADQKQFLIGSQTTLTLGNWEQHLGISFSDNYRSYTDIANPSYPNSFDFAAYYDGQSAQASWQNDLHLSPEETLVFGLQAGEEWGNNSSLYFGVSNPPLTATDETESLFAESLTDLGESFFANLGGRLDNYSSYGFHGTYQAGLAYFLPTVGTKLKANLGTGFLAPTLYQLYAPAPTGNAGLQPETSLGYDFGFEQPLDGSFAKVGATYFHNEFDNLIIYQGYFPTGQYGNSGSFQTQGVETFLELKGLPGFTLNAAYTYTEILTAIPPTQSNSPLLQKPAHQASLDADEQVGPVEVGAAVLYVGARPDFDYTNFVPVEMPSYFLVNLRASVQVDSHVKLFARVDNLFNQYYEEIYGYGTPALSAYGGTKISF